MMCHGQVFKVEGEGRGAASAPMPGRNGRQIVKTSIAKPQRTSPILREKVRINRRHLEYENLVAPGSTADNS